MTTMKLQNTTEARRAEGKRSYEDACGTAHALELIGERWALLVLRELMFGPRRFSEMRSDLPGISANVLSQRLSELERRGLVHKTRLPPPASVQVYEASEWGLEAAPLIRALGRWAVRSPAHDPGRFVSGVSVMMSMQTMFDPVRAGEFEARACILLGETPYVVEIRDGRIDVRRGSHQGCDFTVTATPEEVAAVLYGGVPVDAIRVEGDLALAKRFVTLFPLPPKVA
jgi:DNA-binding HxlR family transcriptional regulator